MIIKAFTSDDIEAAHRLAIKNYNEERRRVPSLPDCPVPPPDSFSDGMGVAAYGDDGKLLGFLCAYGPFDQAFDTPAKGMYTPCHGHAAVRQNRGYIYSRLYQAAAERWVAAGAYSHAVTLYAHDKRAVNSFFVNGFGLRCLDAMRTLEPIEVDFNDDSIKFQRLDSMDIPSLRPMRRALSDHLGMSPCFMVSSDGDFNSWLQRAESRDTLLFAAYTDGSPIAFIEIANEGESFSSCADGTANICGAYCMPMLRGKGIYPALLNFTMAELKKLGYIRLGVDCESINPNANSFWRKHFDVYTYSVVRRIDEKI